MTYPELPEFPPDAEGNDLGWHALNYRTAHMVHAQDMWLELERYVKDYALAHGKAVQEWAAKVCESVANGVTEQLADHYVDWRHSTPTDCAQAIRDGKP